MNSICKGFGPSSGDGVAGVAEFERVYCRIILAHVNAKALEKGILMLYTRINCSFALSFAEPLATHPTLFL